MQTSETMRELRQQPAETIMDRLERLPSSTYFTAMIGSVLASLGLFLAGYRWASVFIGLWAPTILMFGAFAKLLRPSREMAGR